ncbi:MAG TPA: ABC transporter ATP-binding protein [Candidatus Desulfaltia sp.]|nr:ABC transporter ATP-binding protein [Candidatus Desulfaltia sp.]
MSKHGRGGPQDEGGQRRPPMGPRHGPGGMGAMEKAKDPRGALLRLLDYLRPFRLHLAAIGLLTVVGTVLGLAGPYLMGVAIDRYIMVRDLEGLLSISLLLAGTYVASAVTSMVAGWIAAGISQRSLMQMRKELFDHMQTLSLGYFDRNPAGDLMSRLTNDIDAISSALTQNVTSLISNGITIVGVLALMLVLNVRLTLASLIVFPLMMVFTAVVGKRTRESFMGLQVNLGAMNSVMQETVSGQRVVIAFNQQRAVTAKFSEANRKVKEMGIRAMTYAMLVPPMMGILSNANIAIVAGLGGWMTINGLTTVGTIAAFIAYSRRFADPLRQIANLYNNIMSALAGSERIFEVLDTDPEITDAEDAAGFEDFEGAVEFRDVDFGYVEGVPVLRHVSLRAEPGQTIALVGPTGAGKTTVVNLLTRFYDIQGGIISIDGVDVRHIRKDDLRRQLGIVLQDVFLFSGSVMDNIRYGRLDATEEEIMAAARLANADGFIRRLPKGYRTELSERGSNLSQGQRQLLSIARAILADPAILVLDEATSSVDTRTERQIQEALLNLMKGRTSFVIAHRLSTIRNADLVLVINRGEIIERGTHDELLAAQGFYYHLYMSQFKGTNHGPELAEKTVG